MEKHDERRVTVADREVFVSRLVEKGKDAGYMLKTVPSGTLQEDFLSGDGRSFVPISSTILHSGQLKKSILLATPISDAALIVLLRQALAEWSKGGRGYLRTQCGDSLITEMSGVCSKLHTSYIVTLRLLSDLKLPGRRVPPSSPTLMNLGRSPLAHLLGSAATA